MAPKTKPKAKAASAKATPAKAAAKSKSNTSSSPAAGSAVAAVRQSHADEAASENKVIANDTTPESGKDLVIEATAADVELAAEKNTNDGNAKTTPGIDNVPDSKAPEKDNETKESIDVKKDEDNVGKRVEVDLSSIPDPWDAVADNMALKKAREEEWEVTTIDSEPAAPSHLAARDADLSKFNPSEHQRKWLVAADFSGNQFPSIIALGGPLWLRSLALGNNPLTSLDGLIDAYPRLLLLDVSYVELPSIDGAWATLAACPKLQRLVAEGSGISSFEDMEPMPKLRSLELVDNGIEDMDELAVLAGKCQSLEELDLRENDIVTEAGYMAKVKKLFPKLTYLDSQSQKTYVAKRRDEAYKDLEDLDAERTGIDGLYRNENCSCLEGNPCVDPETCKDWKNREKIAAEARKKKGLRDETGKQL